MNDDASSDKKYFGTFPAYYFTQREDGEGGVLEKFSSYDEAVVGARQAALRYQGHYIYIGIVFEGVVAERPYVTPVVSWMEFCAGPRDCFSNVKVDPIKELIKARDMH